MLFGHHPHELKPGQNVLVWGASGGLGSYAIQLINTAGANAIGVISDEDKREFVMDLGAKGVINRKDFNCWGQLPKVEHARIQGVVHRGPQVRQGDLGHHRQGRECRHGLRTPRRGDLPGLHLRGASGRHGRDLRRHHRLQLHLRRPLHVDAPEAPAGQPLRASQAGRRGQQADDRAPLDPCMSEVFPWAEIPKAHMKMLRNEHKPGNMAVLVQAPEKPWFSRQTRRERRDSQPKVE
jgi:crotonyl-CoA carboxylase/reductase